MGNNGNGNNGSFKRSKYVNQVAHEKFQESIIERDKIGHRPSMYKGEVTDDLAYKLALAGLTDEQMADCLLISEETLVRWREEYPSFCQSINNGKNLADARVAEALFTRALGYSHPDIHISTYRDKTTGEVEKVITPITKFYPPDTMACIFWLKNRQRDQWRDVQRKEITGPDSGPIKHSVNVITLDLTALDENELKMMEHIGEAVERKRLEQDVTDIEAEEILPGKK